MKLHQVEELRDFIRRKVQESDLSHTQISARAAAKGKPFDSSQISRIINGETNPKIATLQAVAAGLGVEEDEMFAVARGIKPDKEKIADAFAEAMFSDYSRLSKKDKEALTPLLRALKREVDERLEKSES